MDKYKSSKSNYNHNDFHYVFALVKAISQKNKKIQKSNNE